MKHNIESLTLFIQNSASCRQVRNIRIICSALIILTIASCCNEERLPQAQRDLYASDAKKRNEAALELASCGAKSASAVSRLRELLYDSNVGVQSSAAYALRKIDTPEAREALERAIKARDERRKR
jgi:HEAT repeat protein